jgi:hypothetical protein
MTGVIPPPGGGVTISRSTLRGGQMTPSDLDNLSLRFALPWPCVSAFERSVGSISVEHSCRSDGTCADGGGRSCASATPLDTIETDIAVRNPAKDIGCFMSRSDVFTGDNGLRRRPFRRLKSAGNGGVRPERVP